MVHIELRQLSDQQKVPVDLETYIQKLSNSKRRVTIVNEILQNVQVRWSNLFNKSVLFSLKHVLKYMVVFSDAPIRQFADYPINWYFNSSNGQYG